MKTTLERTRLLHDNVLLRRLTHKTEIIATDIGSSEVVYEELPSGLAISDPRREITRAEVLDVGPKCSQVKPGETVVLQGNIAGHHWKDPEDFNDYVLTRQVDQDMLFAYEVVPYEEAAEAPA